MSRCQPTFVTLHTSKRMIEKSNAFDVFACLSYESSQSIMTWPIVVEAQERTNRFVFDESSQRIAQRRVRREASVSRSSFLIEYSRSDQFCLFSFLFLHFICPCLRVVLQLSFFSIKTTTITILIAYPWLLPQGNSCAISFHSYLLFFLLWTDSEHWSFLLPAAPCR